MKKIRIGNDIGVKWNIYTKTESGLVPYSLVGKDIKLYLGNPLGRKVVQSFNVIGNTISYTFYGKDQYKTGVYKLILVENEGKHGMHTIDQCAAFYLVDCSCKENDNDNNNIEFEQLEFSASMNVGSSGTSDIDLSSYVSTLVQDFSEAQKEQARKNIGAVSAEYIVSVFEELKELIKNGNTGEVVAVLDKAILDLVILG